MINKYFFGFLILITLTTLMVSGCTEKTETNVSDNTIVQETSLVSDAKAEDLIAQKTEDSYIQKIEVFHFHGTNQCYSCKTVGAYAEETVKTYFSDDLKTGKIVFDHINAELPENRDLAMKYEVTGSSLWIGIYMSDGSFSKEENVRVWYKIKDKQDYMNYLKQVLEQKQGVN